MWDIHCFQFFLFSFCVHLFTLFTYFVYYTNEFTNSFKEIQPSYDYIIVGAGTAGSLIAHRLATETNYTFIVLEAGGQGHTLLDAPVLGPFLHGSIFDWQYETVPQEHACFAMKDRKCKLAQGKVVGGSSKLNNMIHIRGNISHYTQWFNGKYTEDHIIRHFDLIEKEILHLSHLQYQSKLSEAVIDASKELGYKYLGTDFNLGFMRNIVSQKHGKRWSISDNLDISKHVISNTLVEKIFFYGNTAKGVRILKSDGFKIKINANKGVILSAGAINSPKILQLSGIGPENILKPLGIRVIKDLPVGRNLQDHIGTGLDFVLFNKSVSIYALDMVNPIQVLKYFFNGKGPWTTPGCEVIGFLSTRNESVPDLQFMVLPVGLSSDKGSLLKKNVNINEVSWEKYFTKAFDSYTTTILPVILHPKSRGHVFINSTDYKIPPLIDPKYLSNKEDREILINGLKLVIKFVKTKSISKLGGFINKNHFPGCEKYEIFTDEYFDCYIQHLTLTSYHPIGTCSMGVSGKNSVVNTSFKVFGINNLYVVDSSVLPTMPSGNINAAVAMIASVFFDANIVRKNRVPVCYSKDFLSENLFKMCFFYSYKYKKIK